MTSDKSPSRNWPADRPMWCDGFDLDLPKVIPDAREIVGDLGDVTLWTMGNTTDGVLNHPNVWHGRYGLEAFFGFSAPARPPGHVASGELVRCTAWEALRDAWPHQYLLHIERQPLWNTPELWPQFETIAGDFRGWASRPKDAAAAHDVVRQSFRHAVALLRILVDHHGRAVDHFEASAA